MLDYRVVDLTTMENVYSLRHNIDEDCKVGFTYQPITGMVYEVMRLDGIPGVVEITPYMDSHMKKYLMNDEYSAIEKINGDFIIAVGELGWYVQDVTQYVTSAAGYLQCIQEDEIDIYGIEQLTMADRYQALSPQVGGATQLIPNVSTGSSLSTLCDICFAY